MWLARNNNERWGDYPLLYVDKPHLASDGVFVPQGEDTTITLPKRVISIEALPLGASIEVEIVSRKLLSDLLESVEGELGRDTEAYPFTTLQKILSGKIGI